MKHIDDVRRENMANLAENCGGVAGLARTLQRSESQVSQWIRGAKHSATGKQRGMRSETARWIEAVTDMPPGWLDTNHEPPKNTCAEKSATYQLPQRHARPKVRDLIALAEQINDDGINQLIGFAKALTATHSAIKTNAKSSG